MRWPVDQQYRLVPVRPVLAIVCPGPSWARLLSCAGSQQLLCCMVSTSRHFKYAYPCRFGSSACAGVRPYIQVHVISHIALHSRTISLSFFDIDTVLQFASSEKETFSWLYLFLLQYHPHYYSYRTASTILAGSGAVHSTQCSAHPWHKAWERSVTLPDAAITVHKPRRGPTDATCGDHKTGSKAAVRHATRRPGLQILSHSTPSATGSQT